MLPHQLQLYSKLSRDRSGGTPLEGFLHHHTLKEPTKRREMEGFDILAHYMSLVFWVEICPKGCFISRENAQEVRPHALWSVFHPSLKAKP